jgi:hypothetical protein
MADSELVTPSVLKSTRPALTHADMAGRISDSGNRRVKRFPEVSCRSLTPAGIRRLEVLCYLVHRGREPA